MRLPSKTTTYSGSVLSKFPIMLDLLAEQDMTPVELYKTTRMKVEDVGEFLEIVDCLYLLGKIELVPDREVLRYVASD